MDLAQFTRQLRYTGVGLLLVFAAAIAGYMYFEDISFFHALWFTLVSLSTVGYGDWVPSTVPGRVLTMMVIVSGAGFFAYTAATTISIVVEGHLSQMLGRRNTLKQISKLENHFIIVGAGRVGKAIIEHIHHENKNLLVIDIDAGRLDELAGRGILVLTGDATDDEVLMSARIMHAHGLVTSLPDDAKNVYVTLTAKGLNPQVKVVARANSPEAEGKLARAGADKVVSPATIGGRRMAVSLLKPNSVDFIDSLLGFGEQELEFEEITVGPEAKVCNQSLKDSAIREITGAYIVAIKSGDTLINNPASGVVIQAGDILIVFGARSQLARLEQLLSSNRV